MAEIGTIAMVNIARMRNAMRADANRVAQLLLSSNERELFARAVTMKRKSELLAGRLAAKCVCMAVRHSALPLPLLDVRREPGAAPFCLWPDGTRQHVSIAHNEAFALALASSADVPCGIDLEASSRELSIEDYFHPIELAQLRRRSDARRCWTLREAWGKLTARGVAEDLERVATVQIGGAWHLCVPHGPGTVATVAAAENVSLAIAVAIGRDGNQDVHYSAVGAHHGKDGRDALTD